MKTLIIWLLILLCVTGVIYAMHLDAGYVLIAYHHTTIQMTLWSGLLALIVGLLVISIVWNVITGIIGLPGYFKKRHAKSMAVKSQALLNKALIYSVKGNFNEAVKDFKKGAKYQDKSLINYLGGAYALQMSGRSEESNALLAKALKSLPDDRETICFVQAQLYLTNQCFAKALQALETVADKNKKQDLWVMLAMRCYIGLAQWQKAYSLYHVFAKLVEVRSGEKQSVLQSIIIGCVSVYAAEDLNAFWSSLPKVEKQKEAYVWLLADRYIDDKQYQAAAELIMHQLKSDCSEDLWELLISCVPDQAHKIYHFAQKQMKYHQDKWYIPYCAAMAVLEEGDMNQAKDYLTQSISIKSTETALLSLASIYNQQGLEQEFQEVCLQLLALS